MIYFCFDSRACNNHLQILHAHNIATKYPYLGVVAVRDRKRNSQLFELAQNCAAAGTAASYLSNL
jgi:hypothetical protein